MLSELCQVNIRLMTGRTLRAGLTIAGSRSAAYFEAQRRIAVTIRNMYEVGQRVPPLESAMSLSAAQAWDSSHREVSSDSQQLLSQAFFVRGSSLRSPMPRSVDITHQADLQWHLLRFRSPLVSQATSCCNLRELLFVHEGMQR